MSKSKKLREWKNQLIMWLFYDVVTEILEDELGFVNHFIENGKRLSIESMRTVPQIGSKVEILIRGNEERIFLVESVTYSTYGVSNKVYGKLV